MVLKLLSKKRFNNLISKKVHIYVFLWYCVSLKIDILEDDETLSQPETSPDMLLHITIIYSTHTKTL